MKRHNLNGYSLLELLGVLAICAIITISIGSGLKYALVSFWTNCLIQDVKKGSFLVLSEHFRELTIGENIVLNPYIEEETSYPYSATKETNQTFFITAKNVSYAVCLKAQKYRSNWLEEIIVNTPDEENKCQALNNDIHFYLNTTLSNRLTVAKGLCRSDSACGECGKCINRKCIYEEGEVKSSDKCVSCSIDGKIGNATKETCEICDNRFFQSIYSTCYTCDDTSGVGYTYKADCVRCPNRYWVGKNGSYGTCSLCPEGGKVNASQTGCDYECGFNQFLNTQTGQCTSCLDKGSVISSQEECNQCSENRFWQYNYTKCFSCDEASGVGYTSKDECLKCENRYWVGTSTTSGSCFLCPEPGKVNANKDLCEFDCGADKFLNPQTGECTSCSLSGAFVSSQEECNQCPTSRFWQYNYTKCFSCNEAGGVGYTSKEECFKCDNRYWVGTVNYSGNCFSCPEGGKLNADRTRCEFECGENQFLNPQTGQCTSCSLSSSLVSSQEECNQCSGTRFWQYNYTKCFSCEEKTTVGYVSKDECLSCPNRYWTGNVLYSGSCHYCDGQVSADGKSCIK